jgi:hypothetical protein
VLGVYVNLDIGSRQQEVPAKFAPMLAFDRLRPTVGGASQVPDVVVDDLIGSFAELMGLASRTAQTLGKLRPSGPACFHAGSLAANGTAASICYQSMQLMAPDFIRTREAVSSPFR